ncbi:FAD/NAD(P)-binding domain-containing protein [Stipitochalara longipes BDJ]|nr:FAD/NAD(P)-binding domain-containing protein [Stipitochalara longipes BDJ]
MQTHATPSDYSSSAANNGHLDNRMNVIVVGAGFGGLTTAIECKKQGLSVAIYEAFAELKALGDPADDERVSDLFDPLSIKLERNGFNLHRSNGELIFNQKMPPKDPEAPMFNGHRADFHQVVFQYALDMGIPIHLGQRCQQYFESKDAAGILLESGEKVTADVVIAADGFRSKGRDLVLGHHLQPTASGHKCFRSWFTGEEILKDPETTRFCSNGDTFTGWIGHNVHFLFSTLKDGKDCSWAITYKPGPTGILFCHRLISMTPEEKILEWDAVYHDPLPTWVSMEGRIALVGDSAHPMLPTSAQGAAQAMEDGVTIAVCLRTAGTENIPAALRTYQNIRYERVKSVQRTGEATREMWHRTDWEKVMKDPSSLSFPREGWIHSHDAEQHAESAAGDEIERVIGLRLS